MDWQERSRSLIGDDGVDKLRKAHVLLFGLGGVGSFAAEALARSGVGRISLVEYDRITDSNRNRQIPALYGTVGRLKIEVMKDRLLEINPTITIYSYPLRMTGDNLPGILEGVGGVPDFIADAIDDLPAKASLIITAKEKEIPLVSSMGTGFRLDVTKLEMGDISRTHTCPLAKKLRRSLREAGITEGVPVVWSKEIPIKNTNDVAEDIHTERVAGDRLPGPASMIFVPAAAGLLMASYIVRMLIDK